MAGLFPHGLHSERLHLGRTAAPASMKDGDIDTEKQCLIAFSSIPRVLCWIGRGKRRGTGSMYFDE
jgi:hypothetical protein